MIGKVENVSKSKTGKSWRVKIGSEYYGAQFDSNIEGATGKMIDFSFDDDVKFGKWVKSWAYATNAAPQPPAAPVAEHGGEHTGLTEAEMRFISNVVGQAILAKTISTPLEISVWAKAARMTLKELA